ncbi:MAG: VCBS repeat-containing protein, partial [Actinomycetota bacterium]
ACTLSTGTGFGQTITTGVIDWGYETGRAWTDFNGDGKADYCRRVGNQYPQSAIQCTESIGAAFGQSFTSGALDWGYDTGRIWADFDGDGKSDYCRRTGGGNDHHIACRISTGSGWSRDVVIPMGWGRDPGAAFADFNGDHAADYCRAFADVSGQHVACTLSTGPGLDDRIGTTPLAGSAPPLDSRASFGVTVSSPVLDWGYDTDRAWADFNGDGKADYCRRVGDAYPRSRVQCTVSTGTAFGATYTSGAVNWGAETGRRWVDFDGDGKADYCRVYADSTGGYAACTLSTGTGFGATIVSPQLDWGYPTGREWADINGDGKADYCRWVGPGYPNSLLQCTPSTGTGFGQTFTSGSLNLGADAGRAWTDFDGDGKADYCRVYVAEGAHAACTLSTGTGFGQTITTGVIDWGYETGRAWTDFNGDGKADYCRWVGENYPKSQLRCTVSTGDGFGAEPLSGALTHAVDPAGVWSDFNGDNKADYCRRNGGGNVQQLACRISTGSGWSTETIALMSWGEAI